MGKTRPPKSSVSTQGGWSGFKPSGNIDGRAGTSAGSWRWRVWHPASMTTNIHQRRRQHIRRGTTSRPIWWRRNQDGDQAADIMAGASAQWRRNQDGSAYGYYSVLTAWIMAGASAPFSPDDDGAAGKAAEHTDNGNHIRPTRRRFLEVADGIRHR